MRRPDGPRCRAGRRHAQQQVRQLRVPRTNISSWPRWNGKLPQELFDCPFCRQPSHFDDVLVSSTERTEIQVGNALRAAAKVGDEYMVRKLIKSADIDFNLTDGNGWTALHHAAQAGYPAVCSLLAQAGANLEVRTADGDSALMITTHSARETRTRRLDKLMNRALDRDTITRATVAALLGAGADVNAAGKDGWTALLWAA